MRPVYDLTYPYDALAFLREHSTRTNMHPHGSEYLMAARLSALAGLAEPHGRQHRHVQLSDEEALAALSLRAHLTQWLAEMEADLIGAARAAGATWEQLAPVLGVGDRRAAHRRYIRLRAAQQDAVDRSDLDERLAALPADTRPVPSVTVYDQLLARSAPASTPGSTQGRPAVTIRPPRIGHDWNDTSVLLLREDGRWTLHGPAPVDSIGVTGFHPHGPAPIALRDITGAQCAAAAAVTALTGRAVLGWTRYEHGRTLETPSSWYARLDTSG